MSLNEHVYVHRSDQCILVCLCSCIWDFAVCFMICFPPSHIHLYVYIHTHTHTHTHTQVLESEAVEFVEEDQYVTAGSIRTVDDTTWGLDRIDQESHPFDHRFEAPCGLTGEGVDVYVLDTGIRYDHNEFDGRVRYPDCDAIDSINGENRKGGDCTGHGTHIAGIVGGKRSGVAPGVRMYSVRVLDCNARGTWNTVLQGLECVVNRTQNSNR